MADKYEDEISGNPVVLPTLAQEFQYNSSGITAAGAADSTSFASGSGGVAVGSINSTTGGTSTTAFRVRFSDTILATDTLTLEFNDGNGWFSSAARVPPSTVVSTVYGASLSSVNSTDYQVVFGNGGVSASGAATYGAAGAAWSTIGTWKWRVKRERYTSTAYGAGLATSAKAGLIQGGAVPGSSGVTAIASGNLGERTVVTATYNSVAATTFENGLTIPLPTAGRWAIQYGWYQVANGATAGTDKQIRLNDQATPNTSPTDTTNLGLGSTYFARNEAITLNWSGSTAVAIVDTTAAKNYYVNTYWTGGSGNPQWIMRAVFWRVG